MIILRNFISFFFCFFTFIVIDLQLRLIVKYLCVVGYTKVHVYLLPNLLLYFFRRTKISPGGFTVTNDIFYGPRKTAEVT